MPNFSPNLNAIVQYNPGIDLSDDAIKLANAGTLVLVGHGSILATGPILTSSGIRLTRKGCIETLRYEADDKLTLLVVDGTSYSGGNINDFREKLTEAALAGKCINFCWDERERHMTMLNVYPQCCCACEQFED